VQKEKPADNDVSDTIDLVRMVSPWCGMNLAEKNKSKDEKTEKTG